MTPADVDPARVAGMDHRGEQSRGGNCQTSPASRLFWSTAVRSKRSTNGTTSAALTTGQTPRQGYISRRLECSLTNGSGRSRAICMWPVVASWTIWCSSASAHWSSGRTTAGNKTIGLGKRTNQNFVFLPHARFIEMLTYKAQLVGHPGQRDARRATPASAASWMVNPGSPGKQNLVGKRVKRGLFVTRDGAAPQRRCEWRVQYAAQSGPKRLWQRERGCGSSPRQDRPGEWATWQQCPCRPRTIRVCYSFCSRVAIMKPRESRHDRRRSSLQGRNDPCGRMDPPYQI